MILSYIIISVVTRVGFGSKKLELICGSSLNYYRLEPKILARADNNIGSSRKLWLEPNYLSARATTLVKTIKYKN